MTAMTKQLESEYENVMNVSLFVGFKGLLGKINTLILIRVESKSAIEFLSGASE